MHGAHAEGWRVPLALLLFFLLGAAVPSAAAADTTTSSTQSSAPGVSPTSTAVTGSATANSTGLTTSTSESNSTSSLPHATDLAILYYSIPELVVLAFFAVGIYLILVRDKKPRRTRRLPP